MKMEEVTLRSLIDTVTTSSSAGKRYCFILGAGASRASGIKTGTEMAKEWLEEMKGNEPKALQEWIEKEKINISDPGLYYSKIYEQRFRVDSASGFIRLQNEMEGAIPSPGYYYLAEIIDSTQNKLVITTNFDSLTEDSLFIYKDKNALVIPHESLAKYIDALANRPTVIKLHRDLLLQPKSDETKNTLPEEWKNSLQKIMDIYVPIVIGYGGNDGSLMGFLESVASKGKIIYWCYKRDNPVNERIRELLEKYRGFLIPIDDFDNTMCHFGERFGYKFSEETIKKVTNERAEKLVNKYQEWRDNRQKPLETTENTNDTESMTFDSLKSLSRKNISELEKRIAEEQKNSIYHNALSEEYLFKRNYREAIQHYTEAIKLDPDNAYYYSSRGANYCGLEEYEKAKADLTKAIELEPDNAEYYYNRSLSYYELKEYEKAKADLTKAIELEPDNAEYYYNRSLSYYELKEHEKAKADLTKAIEIEPYNDDYYNNRGVSYYSLNEYEKAIADFSQAIELKPYSANYYNNRGENYYELNEYEKAIADLSQAIELNPDNAEYYLFLARILCRTGDFDNALRNLNKAMSLDNKLADCYNIRGFISMKKAKQDKVKCKPDVLDDLTKAIELNDDDSLDNIFYKDRAEYYLYSGEPEKAFNDLEKAVALNKRDGISYFLMARYYEITGNTQEYERCMNKMKECRFIPDNSDY